MPQSDSMVDWLYWPVLAIAVVAMAGLALLVSWPFLLFYGIAYVTVGKERAYRFTWNLIAAAVVVICVYQAILWALDPWAFILEANRVVR